MSDPATPRQEEGGPADRSLSGPCPNCGDPTEGNYCPNCGQRRVHRRISLRRMLMEVLEDQFALNATLPRTLGALMVRPGLLSAEYVNGRIQRYIPPFRLYLAASVLFFLLLTFFMPDVQLSVGGEQLGAARDSARAALAELDSTERAALRRSGVAGVLLELEDSVPTAAGTVPGDSVPGVAADTAGSPYLWGKNITITTGWRQLDTLIVHKLDELRRLPPNQAFDAVRGEAVQRLPTAVFLMLPVFALILKLLYVRRKRYYVEHFVFGLHTHAFTFLLFTVMLLGRSDWVRVPASLWMIVYFYLAMKRFYGQGHVRTLIKYVILFNLYSIVIAIGIVGLLTAALLLA